MHQSAWVSIQTLVDKLDTMNDNLSTSVGVLYVRLLLNAQQYKKALAYLNYLLKHLNTNISTLVAEETNIQDILPRLKPSVIANLKLLTMLTLVVNRKLVVIPEEKVSHKIVRSSYNSAIMTTSNQIVYILIDKVSLACLQSPEYSALKAHQYYLMKDFQMAAKQMKKINGELNG